MSEFFGSIWWLIVSLGVLVTFHEFGHFWVARRLGVRVLRFSVGFGRPLWRRVGRDGTEYVVAAIPLGGYVRFLDEREGEVPAAQLDESFNRRPVGQRFAIVAAGPLFNLLLCVGLLWLMFLIGKPDFEPVVGRTQGVAAAAGLERGDRLVSVDGEAVPTWTHASMALTAAALDRVPIELEVVESDGDGRVLDLDLSGLGSFDETAALQAIGIWPIQILLDPVVAEVSAGSAAERAGLLAGDRIVSVAGTPILSFDQIGDAVSAAAGAGNGPVEVVVERGGGRLRLQAAPQRQIQDGVERWILGVSAQRARAEYDAVLRYGPVAAVGAAFSETWRLTRLTIGMVGRMISGKASLRNLSGPVSIAQYANASARLGAAWFLFFLAVLSLSLFIMNLLPIPILDGGHLLYYLIEIIKGSPVSERALMAGQYVGLALLAGLMGLAFYNDILRLFS
ncbi:MAG TPA: RIP metalloprotease RseP [Xanthomonadaceae bacterium]|nr:RIP metalloprotease RseP [Xanthomonadaceae bacterium]